MHKTLGGLALAGLAAALTPAAFAAESYDSCTGFIDTLPATIATQGNWCLRADLATAISSGAAITIAANNVTVDCNGFRVGGLAAGPATLAEGIVATDRTNATVRNCNIRGFAHGVHLSGLQAVVEDNRLDGNTYIGIWLSSREGLARRNLVLDTGGSTNPAGIAYGGAYGIYAQGRNDLLDNTVQGVAPTPTVDLGSTAYGLLVSRNDSGSISGNRVGGLSTTGEDGYSIGIELLNAEIGGPGRPTVTGNAIVGPGAGLATAGIRCEADGPRLRGNTIARVQVGISLCGDAGGNVFAP